MTNKDKYLRDGVSVEKLLDKIISEKLNEYIKKYNILSIKSVKVLLNNGNFAFEVFADNKI